MTRDRAIDTTDGELRDVLTEAANCSLLCTVLRFSKCLTQQSAFTMTNFLSVCYFVS